MKVAVMIPGVAVVKRGARLMCAVNRSHTRLVM
jgi:hypothetical protein